MSHFRHTLLTIALSTAALASWAQATPEQAQHQARVLATEQLAAPFSDLSTPPSGAGTMADMDSKMKTMREMHEKMMNAKTPEESHALMAEHMKTMQDGMAMMSMMGGAGMAGMQGENPRQGHMKQRQLMMEKRMKMMETMMQMMMDCMPPPSAQ